MSLAVRRLACKIGAIVTIAPIFAAYAQNANLPNDGSFPPAQQSQSSLLLEVQALRKEVAELRNLVEMQAYQIQQIQQQAGISVTSQQAVTQEVPQNYNQYPSAPPSASPVTNGQYPYAGGGNQQNLPVVDEVQIGNSPTASNAPQGQGPDFTKPPVYPGNNNFPVTPPPGYTDGTQFPNQQQPVPNQQPVDGANPAIDAGNPPFIRPNVSTTLSEDVLYQQAFTNLKEANHKKAVEQFKIQLQTYPNGEYADDALYWIGESSYVNRDLSDSKKHFQLLIDQYSASHRVPDALLKVAMIEKEQGNKSKAKEIFQQVIKLHPKSNAAISARNSLAHL